jgi:hypothetical protein
VVFLWVLCFFVHKSHTTSWTQQQRSGKMGTKNYTRIFDTISKFAADVDKSLSEFDSALMPLKYTMKELSQELRNWRPEGVRFKDLEESDKTQGRRKREKTVLSDSDNEFFTLSPKKNPESSQRKPEKKEIPVKVKVEVDLGMQEAQGPDMTLKKISRRRQAPDLLHPDQCPQPQESQLPRRKDLPQNIWKKASCKYVYSIRIVE